MVSINLGEVYSNGKGFELTEEDIKEYLQPYIDSANNINNAIENKDYDFVKTFSKLFNEDDKRYQTEREYDYHTPFMIEEYFGEEVGGNLVFEMAVLEEILLNKQEEFKYDYPPFYEIYGKDISIYFKLEDKYYVYDTRYHRSIYELKYHKDKKAKYYYDITHDTINKFENITQ